MVSRPSPGSQSAKITRPRVHRPHGRAAFGVDQHAVPFQTAGTRLTEARREVAADRPGRAGHAVARRRRWRRRKASQRARNSRSRASRPDCSRLQARRALGAAAGLGLQARQRLRRAGRALSRACASSSRCWRFELPELLLVTRELRIQLPRATARRRRWPDQPRRARDRSSCSRRTCARRARDPAG